MGLFEPLSREEYERETALIEVSTPRRRSRAAVTEPRNNTTWFGLPHVMGYCTCENHDTIQETLNPTAQEYRQKYPVRMTYEIREGVRICRDCYVNEGDK